MELIIVLAVIIDRQKLGKNNGMLLIYRPYGTLKLKNQLTNKS